MKLCVQVLYTLQNYHNPHEEIMGGRWYSEFIWVYGELREKGKMVLNGAHELDDKPWRRRMLIWKSAKFPLFYRQLPVFAYDKIQTDQPFRRFGNLGVGRLKGLKGNGFLFFRTFASSKSMNSLLFFKILAIFIYVFGKMLLHWKGRSISLIYCESVWL